MTAVKIGTFTYAKRRCTRVELTHAGKAGGQLKHYKNVVYFDQQTNLPIRVENYGWPDEDNQPAPLDRVVQLRQPAHQPRRGGRRCGRPGTEQRRQIQPRMDTDGTRIEEG